jgi:two-component sensor histidine kinase
MVTIGLAFAIGMARQIARGEEVQRLLLTELNHRVKNTLAIVQSVAAQTFRETSDPNEARRKFDDRLIAIGRTHALLSDEQWAAAFVHDVVRNVFQPHLPEGSARLKISGPEIRIEARCAMMLSLALHELATNAAKYGALSNATGHITVAWQRADPEGRTVRLTWTESGGPPVRQTEHRGFGSRLIEEAFPRQFGSRVELALNPTGVCCTLEFPVA